MTTYQVTFRADDDNRVLWSVEVEVDGDYPAEAIELAADLFAQQRPQDAALPRLSNATLKQRSQ